MMSRNRHQYSCNQIVIVLLLFFLLPIFADAQETALIKEKVKTFMKTGNIQTLSDYFNGFVGLTIPGFEGVVNDIKAKSLLKNYFNHKPEKYVFRKEGFNQNTYFIIGKFEKEKKKRIIYFLFSKNGSKYYIQQIEIE